MNYKPTNLIKIKDIMRLASCSYATAQRFRNDIAEEYEIEPKNVCFNHYTRYFNLVL